MKTPRGDRNSIPAAWGVPMDTLTRGVSNERGKVKVVGLYIYVQIWLRAREWYGMRTTADIEKSCRLSK